VQIPLDREKSVPLARQIQAHLERLIAGRLLAPGVKLPATRELAQSLGVNRATVALAYEELIAAGWARAHVGQGTFVASPPDGAAAAEPVEPPARLLNWSALLSRSARIVESDGERARANAPGVVRDGVISFAGGMPDSGLFPTDAFRRALNEVVREEGEALLQYYPVGGYPPLRRYLATYLLRFGLEARAEDILIVNGSQQGFDLIARTLLDPGDAVAIEQPTYPRAMQVFRSFGASLLAVNRDVAGPRVDAFERLLERQAPKLFYCQPSAHNPTGLTIRRDVAAQLLAVAARHQVPVVEDGFDGSLYYGERPPAPLKALDRDGVVVYIGTFSKVLFPGLRLGWLVAPPPLADRLRAAKQLADLHTSALLQAAVHRFCERRLLDRHVARIAGEYRRRRDALVGGLRSAGFEIDRPKAALYLFPKVPPQLGRESAAAARALLDTVRVATVPGLVFGPEGESHVRFSFSVPEDTISGGVEALKSLAAAAAR